MIDDRLKGEEIYLLGSGTSLKFFDFEKLSGKNVIAINHSIEHYPEAPMFLFGDKVFLKKTTFDIESYKGLIFTSYKNRSHDMVKKLRDQGNFFLFEDIRSQPTYRFYDGLFHPTSSGILALNLALIMGAKKVYLLGYDYFYDEGNIHFYDMKEKKYPHHYTVKEEKIKQKLIRFMPFNKFSQRVLNLSFNSEIDVFPKMHLSEFFA